MLKSIPTYQSRKRPIGIVVTATIITILYSTFFFHIIVTNEIALTVFIGLLAVAFYFLEDILNNIQYEFYNEHFVRKNRNRRKVFQNWSIVGYRLEQYTYRHQICKRLLLKTTDGYLILEGNDYKNYLEIVGFIQKRFKILGKERFRNTVIRNGLIWYRFILLLIAFFLLATIDGILSPDKENLKGDIKFVSATLTTHPRIKQKYHRSSPPSDYIHLQVKEYPELEFRIRGLVYSETLPSIMEDIWAGQEIKLGISLHDLQSKIQFSSTPSFIGRYFSWHVINLYQLEHQGKKYIDMEEVSLSLIKLRSGVSILIWFLMLAGIGCVYFAVRRDYLHGLY